MGRCRSLSRPHDHGSAAAADRLGPASEATGLSDRMHVCFKAVGGCVSPCSPTKPEVARSSSVTGAPTVRRRPSGAIRYPRKVSVSATFCSRAVV